MEQTQFRIQRQMERGSHASAFQAAIHAVIAGAGAIFPGGGDARVDLIRAVAHE